ncbi:MAG: hypothetical protein ACTSRG_25985 [Candidatus Helarchaeota archaeon]
MREIWETQKEKVETQGTTPLKSVYATISRYSDEELSRRASFSFF